jgi:prepilin-type N-terminal cleavage/methylation domain-containing protein
MHLQAQISLSIARGRRLVAFTLIEVMLSVAVIGILFVSLYSGMSSGFALINDARENLRATQIILERVEVMRLYSWAQITSNGFIPTNFTASYYPPIGSTNSGESKAVSGGGITYYGTVVTNAAPVDDAYADKMRLITITLKWTNGNMAHERIMQTMVSANGLQKYVY